MSRPSVSNILMRMALLWSERSTCSSRARVGAILVDRHNRVLATGYNGSPTGQPHCDEVGCVLDSDGHCKRAVHAEENSIVQCARSGVSSVGLTMYCTHSPCELCTRIIIQAGISCVVWKNDYGSKESIERVIQALQNANVRMYILVEGVLVGRSIISE